MNKSQIRISRKTDKNFRSGFDRDGSKIRSPSKKVNRNNSKFGRNMKINSPKHTTNPEELPSLKIKNQKTSNYNKVNLRLQNECDFKLLSISDEIEDHRLSVHKKKEGIFFRPAQYDEDKIVHSYNENKRLL